MTKNTPTPPILDLSEFDDLRQRQEEGTSVEIRHPATDAVLCTIVVAGPDSKRAQAADQEMIARRMQGRRMRKLSAEELHRESRTKLAACVMSWEGITDKGEPVECTRENVLAVFERAPWIAEQVAEGAGTREAFFPGAS